MSSASPSATRASIVSSLGERLVEPARRLLLCLERARRRGPRWPGSAAASPAGVRLGLLRPAPAPRRRARGAERFDDEHLCSPPPRRGPGSGRRPARACPANSNWTNPKSWVRGPSCSRVSRRSVPPDLALRRRRLPLVVVGQRELRRARSARRGFRSRRAGWSAAATGRVSAARRTALRRAAPSGLVADVHVVVVVGQGEAGFARQVLERDHLVGVHRPLQLQTVLISSSVSVPGPWWPVTGTPSIVGDVDRVAGASARRRCRRWSGSCGRTSAR